MKVFLRALSVATLAAAVLSPAVHAQKRPLDHDAYDLWNRIQGEVLSPDGAWLAYGVQPGDGDGELILRRVPGGTPLVIARGSRPSFSDDSGFLVFSIQPADSVEEEEEEGEATGGRPGGPGGRGGNGGPPDTLGILAVGAADLGALVRIPAIESFRVPEEGPAIVAYLLEREDAEDGDEEPAEEEEPAAEEEAAEEEDEEREKAEGSPLVLRDLESGEEHRFEDVTDYAFTEDGAFLYYMASNEDGTADGAYRVDTSSGAVTALLTGEGAYTRMAVSEATGAVAFLTNRDDWDADEPAVGLYAASTDDAAARLVASGDTPGVPDGWWIAENGGVRFSDSGARLFVGTAPRPEPEPEDGEPELDDHPDLDADEEAEIEVDVWNWRDGYLQPMQLVQADRERNRSYEALVPFEGGALVQLETEELASVSVGDGGDADLALGETDLPYRQLVSWDGRYNDVWLVEPASGERRPVLEMVRGGASLSPGGDYVYWWDGTERSWFAAPVEGGDPVDITASLPFPVHNELDDRPQPPGSYGAAGWTEDGDRFLVYDAHDLWAVDPAGVAEPRNLTEGAGRREGLRFRYVRTDDDLDFVPLDRDVLLSAFNLTTKDDGYYRDRFDGDGEPRPLVVEAARFSTPEKAEDADRFLLTRQTFQDFPDLYVAGPDLDDLTRVSDANPQQDEYRWGTAELVEWMSADREPLQGILYKPEGFDPSEQYPMMVYFYERSSDGLHGYTVPAAGSSSINRSFYVSRGYLLFVPDIPYEIGYPGESARDAVVSGVLNLVDEGFVDPDRIGVQGHSWGGYQIAYMITRSNIFAAAEAGAPVSNMTSAYGGIRWSSGMSRMFQYEKTQSRIGGHLWDAQNRYIENSPVFFADKIETPLLMLHNDEDGAVPWYQGIEMFVAMRRLEKPVWMLNYNGEDHGLREDANQKDWAIRMQQFFDHYLMDAPAPVWLAEGVPAVMKGRTLGLQLLTEDGRPITEEGGGG